MPTDHEVISSKDVGELKLPAAAPAKKPAVKKALFCAHCQTDTEQEFRVSANGKELISLCACGRELKFPSSATAAELRGAFEAHKAANQGQVRMSEVPEDPADHPAMKALLEA